MSHGIGLGLRYFIVKESQKRKQIRVFYLYCKYCRVVVSILNIYLHVKLVMHVFFVRGQDRFLLRGIRRLS